LKQVLCHDSAEYSIAEVFQSLVVLRCISLVRNSGLVRKGQFEDTHIDGRKTDQRSDFPGKIAIPRKVPVICSEYKAQVG
jgi:hypothetical protein